MDDVKIFALFDSNLKILTFTQSRPNSCFNFKFKFGILILKSSVDYLDAEMFWMLSDWYSENIVPYA